MATVANIAASGVAPSSQDTNSAGALVALQTTKQYTVKIERPRENQLPCDCYRLASTENAEFCLSFEQPEFRLVDTTFNPPRLDHMKPNKLFLDGVNQLNSQVFCTLSSLPDEPLLFQATIYCAGGTFNNPRSSDRLTGCKKIELLPGTTTLIVTLINCTQVEIQQE